MPWNFIHVWFLPLSCHTWTNILQWTPSWLWIMQKYIVDLGWPSSVAKEDLKWYTLCHNSLNWIPLRSAYHMLRVTFAKLKLWSTCMTPLGWFAKQPTMLFQLLYVTSSTFTEDRTAGCIQTQTRCLVSVTSFLYCLVWEGFFIYFLAKHFGEWPKKSVSFLSLSTTVCTVASNNFLSWEVRVANKFNKNFLPSTVQWTAISKSVTDDSWVHV